MQNLDLCKELLQMILPELAIEHIEMLQLQKGIDVDKDAHGIRLDVYVHDENRTVYSLEMQMVNTRNLEKRIRYYSSQIDLQLLNKSENYNELRDSYIIFICPFDLFGAGRHIYTFRSTCQEDKNIVMNDGTAWIFLNTEGKLEDISADLREFLDYVAGRKSRHSFIDKLESAVKEAKQDREWGRQVMTLLMRDFENQEIGRREGKQEGIKEGIKEGILEGIKEGRLEGILHMLSTLRELDVPVKTIRAKLKEKYKLSDDELNKFLENN
jgi:predicted transposase/invertase (TIGR01784 family)